MLKLWSEQGIIRLKYADESGFERASDIGYSYIRRGQQQHINQPHQRGKRISALGFLEPKKSFEYGLVVGGFNSERYLKLMDWQAKKAAEHLEKTGQITVIIQDGASFHKSKPVKQHWQRWQSWGLFIFFLPPYTPQMNRIEDEWLHLKRDELSSRVFEDEYIVAMTLIAAIDSRAVRCGYDVERFKFS